MPTESNPSGERDLAAEIAALRAEIAHIGEKLAALVRGQAQSAGAAMGDAIGAATEQLADAAAATKESAARASNDLERRIEANPLTAVLVAAGIGLAVGLISKPRG